MRFECVTALVLYITVLLDIAPYSPFQKLQTDNSISHKVYLLVQKDYTKLSRIECLADRGILECPVVSVLVGGERSVSRYGHLNPVERLDGRWYSAAVWVAYLCHKFSRHPLRTSLP